MLNCVQRWVRVIRKVSETHVFKDSEEKQERGEVVIISDAHETPIHATNLEGINDLLGDGYQVDDDRLKDPDNKSRPASNNGPPVNKQGWKWYTILGQQDVDYIQQKLMGRTNNASVH